MENVNFFRFSIHLTTRIKRISFILLIIAFDMNRGFSQEFQQSVDIRIPFVPALVTINGRPAVYYELHLTNFSTDSIVLKKVEIADASDATVLMSIERKDLKARYTRIGTAQKDGALPPGSSGVIFLELSLQKGKPAVQLSHRLELEIQQGGIKKEISVQGAFIQLSQKPQLVLGPPLGAGAWAAVYEPSWEKGHRRSFYTVNGTARLPGRFAIDFIKLDSMGQYAKGDNNLVKDWYGYGMDVLAVNDGVVASVRDDFPESETLSGHPKYPAGKATGNFISLDIGNHQVVFYEHLKPGSIKVMAGQKVKKGDVIAAIGFTGQTQGPHLHFHVADGNSPLGAEGIPFVFDHFTILGSYPDFEKFGKEPWVQEKNAAGSFTRAERPAPNTVISF